MLARSSQGLTPFRGTRWVLGVQLLPALGSSGEQEAAGAGYSCFLPWGGASGPLANVEVPGGAGCFHLSGHPDLTFGWYSNSPAPPPQATHVSPNTLFVPIFHPISHFSYFQYAMRSSWHFFFSFFFKLK